MNRSLLFLIPAALSLLPGCGIDTPKGPRGWYHAGSKLEDKDALGGFGHCDNFPKHRGDKNLGKPGELSLIAFPGEVVRFRYRKAFLLRLVNRTEKTMAFSACDSALLIVQEALDSDRKWKPLERFPDSFCGNSYHRVFLEPNEYWEFFAVPPEGRFHTRLRFRLETIAAGGGTMYSNEYEGGINPSAFVRDAANK